jgi:hypothetical protein
MEEPPILADIFDEEQQTTLRLAAGVARDELHDCVHGLGDDVALRNMILGVTSGTDAVYHCTWLRVK